jgi:serine protease Do
VKRSPNGTIARLKIKSETLTPASIGRIAINDAGNTLGIVDAVEGGEATLVPVGLVRNAVSRVIARQSSVPRPWLGVRGEPIGDRSLDRMTSGGWELERARALTEKRQGILLTSITPGSPAALAQLRPGDVILSVNNGDIKNAEDFSWLLEQAGPGSSVKFTVARPDKVVAEALAIKLSESPDPFFGLKQIERYKKLVKPGSLMAQGIETIRLMPQAAAGFGGNGGLLVVYVKPTAAAYKAGLRAGDLIETIDGHQVGAAAPLLFLNKPGAGATFTVVRKKERLFLKVPAADTP